MLKKVKTGRAQKQGGHYAIVASTYNRRYVDAMVKAAVRTFREARVQSVRVVRVPGAFEIPVVAARLARVHFDHLSAVICLGVIIRGETTHAQHIGESVTDALMRIAVTHEVPMIHEVLLLENTSQALVRCVSATHNRGTEAARTALEMARVMRQEKV